jgi:hypothetical protein
LVPLKSFEAGWGWDAQLRQYVRKKYKQDLAGLIDLDPQLLATLLRGKVLEERPYATIKWVLHLAPFRPLELYWLFDFDEEFGHDLHVLFAPKSLVVPTEDAYVFAWDYLALLARYGRGAFPLVNEGPGPGWLAFTDFAPQAAGPIKDKALSVRDELLPLITADLVEVAVRRLDSGVAHPYGNGWEVAWPLLGDLAMRLRYNAQGLEIAFDSHGAKKYGHDFLMSFTWLYLNALLRECRQVEPSLPRLSQYL